MEVAVFPNAVKPTVFPFFQTLEKIFDKKISVFICLTGCVLNLRRRKFMLTESILSQLTGSEITYVMFFPSAETVLFSRWPGRCLIILCFW